MEQLFTFFFKLFNLVIDSFLELIQWIQGLFQTTAV